MTRSVEHLMNKKFEVHLTPRELADRWGLSQHTLANWRASGKGPPFVRIGEVGSRILYPIEGVNTFEDSNQLLLSNTRKQKQQQQST